MSMFDDVLGMGRTSVCEGAYEPEVEEITMESVGEIPSYMDPIEFMTQVACEQEMNMQRLDMAIMAEEYVYLRENGKEMVNEAASVQGIVDKFKKGVDWLWNNITKFFKEVQKKVEEALKLDTRFLAAYETKAKKVSNVKFVTVFTPDTIKCANTYSHANEFFKSITGEVAKIYNRVESIGADETFESIKKKANANIFGAFAGEDPTAKNVTKYMLNFAKGKDMSPVEKEFSVDTLLKDFKDSKNQKELLKSAYTDNKKAINQMYKGAKKLESLAKKHKVLSTDESKKIHIGVKVINSLGRDLTIVNKGMVKIMNQQRSALKKGIVKAASLGSDSVQKANKAATESASMIESVQFGEIL